MAPWPVIAAAGVGLGALSGLFGVGGSALATPLLSLLGLPGLIAVASPLPATIPTAIAAVIPYLRRGEARPKAAAWTLLGAVPASILGALLSGDIGGTTLLVASGLVVAIVGWRVLQPISTGTQERGTARRHNRPLLVAVSAALGLLTGLLANGGGFLLVPIYLLVFGLDMTQAAGTSLLVIIALSLPTTATHWALGHINWTVAAALTLGSVPASALTAHWAQSIDTATTRRAFGWLLITSGLLFTAYRLLQ
jgi:uncharacterized membrane protein YfcA